MVGGFFDGTRAREYPFESSLVEFAELRSFAKIFDFFFGKVFADFDTEIDDLGNIERKFELFVEKNVDAIFVMERRLQVRDTKKPWGGSGLFCGIDFH